MGTSGREQLERIAARVGAIARHTALLARQAAEQAVEKAGPSARKFARAAREAADQFARRAGPVLREVRGRVPGGQVGQLGQIALLAVAALGLLLFLNRKDGISKPEQWDAASHRIVVYGEDGPKILSTVGSLSKCRRFTESKTALEIRTLSEAAEQHVKGELRWSNWELVRVHRNRNVFEALLESSWQLEVTPEQQVILVREQCSICTCDALATHQAVGALREVHDIVGVALEPSSRVEGRTLSSGIEPVCAYVPTSTEHWLSFSSFLASSRGEWFTWPYANPDVFGDWSMWLSRFCDRFKLYNAHLASRAFSAGDCAGSPADGTFAAMDFHSVTRLNVTFQKEHDLRAHVDIAESEVHEIVDYAKGHGEFVSMTVVNSVFLSTARSWLCNVRELGIQPPRIVWITTDETSYNALRQMEGTKAVMIGMRGGGGSGNAYGQPGYWRLMLERTILFRKLLEHRIAIFAFETDQIWLHDPVPFLLDLVADGAEVVGTMDSRNEIGGNLLFLTPTPNLVRLWQEVSDRFLRSYEFANLDKKKPDTYTYIPNDQSQLSALVLFDAEFRRENPVVFRALHTERFVDGRWYENFYKSPESKNPVLINNNFVIGVDQKTERAKKAGHWFVNENTGQCLNGTARAAAGYPPIHDISSEHHKIVQAPRSLMLISVES